MLFCDEMSFEEINLKKIKPYKSLSRQELFKPNTAHV